MDTDASPCYYCGRPASLLCDGVLGYPYQMYEDRRVHLTSALPYTCDRPLCGRCVEKSSPVFWDGTDEAGNRVGEIDSRDHCRDCVREGRAPGGWLELDAQRLFCTPEEGRARQAARVEGAALPPHLHLLR